MSESIFVNIASFCDPVLSFTLESLFDTVDNPENIVVGVVDQNKESIAGWLAQKPFAHQVRYLHIDPVHSRGACWARHLAQTLYDNEDYYLQVDSHTWFEPKWDKILIEQLERLKQYSKKPIVTAYPGGFTFENNKPIKTITNNTDILAFKVKPDQTLTKDNCTLGFKGIFHKPSDCTTSSSLFFSLGFHLAGGFIFTKGDFVKEIPYDPQFYFSGEEQNLALRAFTHGWDLFHPQYHYIPLCHLYKSQGQESQGLHWRKDIEEDRKIKWTERHAVAKKRLCALIAGKLEKPYGLGNERSLEDYAACSNINYSTFTIGEHPLILIETFLNNAQYSKVA